MDFRRLKLISYRNGVAIRYIRCPWDTRQVQAKRVRKIEKRIVNAEIEEGYEQWIGESFDD
jgi:hypothetical protein